MLEVERAWARARRPGPDEIFYYIPKRLVKNRAYTNKLGRAREPILRVCRKNESAAAKAKILVAQNFIENG